MLAKLGIVKNDGRRGSQPYILCQLPRGICSTRYRTQLSQDLCD